MKCFQCNGEYKKVVSVFESDTPYGRLIVPNIEVLTCDVCSDECVDKVNSEKIDKAMEALKQGH